MNAIAQNPYVGPRTFSENERDRFFGREREARELLSLTISGQLVVFYAQSGAGKSSLVNTCLIPDLKKKGFKVFPVARVGGDAPTGLSVDNIYIFNLMRILAPSETTPEALAGLKLTEFFAQQKRAPSFSASVEADSASERQILIVDQFEEIFSTHHDQWEKREDFLKQLEQVMEEYPNLWVLLVMREDYIAYLDPYAHLFPDHARIRYYMQRLSRESAFKAVKKPVESLRPFAEGVAEKLVEDLCSIKVQKPNGTLDSQPGQYVEPVQLQVVCYSLWENLPIEGTQITEKDLQDVGDVNQSLGRYYATRVKSVAELQGASERSIRQWFGRKLISTSGIRNMVLREVNKQSGGVDDEVIQALQSDLVRAEKRGGATWYELTHDRLVEPIIENNNKWFDENSSILERQAELWAQRNRSDGLLFAGKELLDTEEWVKQSKEELGELENDFLNSCRNLKEKQNRSRERQRNWIIGVSVAMAVVMVILAGLAWKGRNEAIAAEAVAKAAEAAAKASSMEAQEQAHYARGNELAVNSQAVFGTDNQLGLLLALESLDEAELGGESRLPLAEDVLRRTIEQIGAAVPLAGHEAKINTVIVSPDGHWVASASNDTTIRLWDLTVHDPSKKSIVLSGHSTSVYSLAFSPDGHWLASGGSDDATIRLWDVTAEDPSANPIVLSGHSGPIVTLAFSRNGHWLASGGDDATVRLWDMTAPSSSVDSVVLDKHISWIRALAFSPDGHWLASGSYDSTVMLWDITAQDPSTTSVVLIGHNGNVNSLAFSPNGHWLASGGDDTTVRLWNITTQDPSADSLIFSGHTGVVNSLAFSPNGDWLASGSNDNTVRLWNMVSQEPSINPVILSGYSASIYSLVFTPNGHWLASGGSDTTVRLWDMTEKDPSITPIILKGHSNYIYSLAASPDSQWLVSAGDDIEPRLWDISPQSELLKPEQGVSSYEMIASLSGHAKGINALSFSSDGYQLASASEDNTIRLWNFQTGLPTEANNILQSVYGSGPVNALLSLGNSGDSLWVSGTGNNKLLVFGLSEGSLTEESVPLAGHEGAISVLAFTENVGLAVPNNTNYSIELWEGDPAQKPLILTGHKGVIHSMAFSPDSRWLASGGDDATIILWDVEDVAAISSVFLKGQTGDVYAVAFSPDGRWLASASSDSTVRLWDVSKGAPDKASYILRGHQGAVRSLVFSPAGRWLASAGDDSTIRLWDMSDASVAPIVLNGNTGSITTLTFSPDGRWLVSGGGDANLQIWGTGMDVLKLQACQIANRNLTWQEWRKYFKDIPYEKTCAGFPSHPSVAINLRDEGDKLARSGDIDAAIAKYREAQKIDSVIDLVVYDLSFDVSSVGDIDNPEARATVLAAQELINVGDNFAQSGDFEGAVAKYREALTIVPSISFDELETSAKESATQALIDTGNILAQTGDVEGAVAKYREALTIDSTISDDFGDPETLAKEIAVQALLEAGDSLAKTGDVDGAAAKYREALMIDPAIGDDLGDPETVAKDFAAQALLETGDSLAQVGEIEEAVAKYREALILIPAFIEDIGDPKERATNMFAQIAFDEGYNLAQGGNSEGAKEKFNEALTLVAPYVGEGIGDIDSRVKSLTAQALMDLGYNLAQQGDIEGAVAKYQEALDIAPFMSNVLGDPQIKAENLAATALLYNEIIINMSDVGDISGALSTLSKAKGLTPETVEKLDAYFWNSLCWDGSRWNHAVDVKDACEKAIGLALDNGAIRDSRGLNRALLGDFQGAIEDFEYAVKWFQLNGYEKDVINRKAWIKTLKNNQNPFDEAALEKLQNE